MTPHRILPRRSLDTKIITAETPFLLLGSKRLDLWSAEGFVEAYGTMEGLEEDGSGRGVTEKSHCVLCVKVEASGSE